MGYLKREPVLAGAVGVVPLRGSGLVRRCFLRTHRRLVPVGSILRLRRTSALLGSEAVVARRPRVVNAILHRQAPLPHLHTPPFSAPPPPCARRRAALPALEVDPSLRCSRSHVLHHGRLLLLRIHVPASPDQFPVPLHPQSRAETHLRASQTSSLLLPILLLAHHSALL